MNRWQFPYVDAPASRRSFLLASTSLAAAAMSSDRALSIELTKLKNASIFTGDTFNAK